MTEGTNPWLSELIRPFMIVEYKIRSAVGLPIPAPTESLYDMLTKIEGREVSPILYIEQYRAGFPIWKRRKIKK